MFRKFNLSLLLSFLSVALGPVLFADEREMASAPTTPRGDLMGNCRR